ncbi:MAG TPA: hypothetical protein VMZ27_06045 [Candidatus Saccharimonadales bacterium]|nr:hypothetical protein [Candidatus Saccharimonadales bacterium]
MNSDPIPPPAPAAPSPQRPPWLTRLAGIVAGDLAIGVTCGIWFLVKAKFSPAIGNGLLSLPSMFLVPALGGLIASYIWRSVKPSISFVVLNSLWMTLLALVVGAVAFAEGAICLLILSPIFFVAVLTGALVGRILFKADPTRLQVSILPVLALIALAEPLARVERESVVRDELVIRAPAAKVWPEVKTFPRIKSQPRFWLFRLGLPYPESTTASGDFVDADRQCIFSGGAVFKEKVMDFVPNKRLTFEITESPRDPELIGHLSPHRGQFLLRENSDGTTTLIGSTWYTLHIRPLWYFDLWTHHIFRAVHLRVMEDVRRRAELSP